MIISSRVPCEPCPPTPLPASVHRGLRWLDLKLRVIGTLRGLGTTALILALGSVAGMGADFLWELSGALRWGIWGAWVAVGLVAIGAMVLRPLARRWDPVDLAALVEHAHPELGERLTSAVALIEGRPHGSPALIAVLAEEAATRARRMSFGRAISAKGAIRRFAIGVMITGLIIAPAVVWPDPFGILGRRFLAPWANLDRVSRYLIRVSPGDHVAQLGCGLAIQAEVRARFGNKPAPREAWLEWSDTDGTNHRIRMVPWPTLTSKFEAMLPRLTGSLTYRVACETARSRWHRISAVEPPDVSTLTAQVEPPSYMKMTLATFRNPERIEVWEGSRITLTIETNKPVRRADVVWPVVSKHTSVPGLSDGSVSTTNGDPLTPSPTEEGKSQSEGSSEAGQIPNQQASKIVPLKLNDDGRGGSVTALAEVSGSFLVQLEDEHRFEQDESSCLPARSRRLMVRVDGPPTVTLQEMKDQNYAVSDDILNIEILARDDIAIASAELHYVVEHGGLAPETGKVVVPLEGFGTPLAQGEATLRLASLGLKPGDSVSYRVRVADNRPAPKGPNVVWSSQQTLRIVEKAEPLLTRRTAAERKGLQEQLETLKKMAVENRQDVEQLRYAADAAARGNGRWDEPRDRALARREASARQVADRLRLLARDFEEQPSFRPLARLARLVAEVEAEAARAMIARAQQARDSEQRLADLRQADARLATVQTRLDELQRRFEALARSDDERHRLRDLAERQDELAKQAKQLAADPAGKGGDRARLDQLQAEQGKLQRDLESLLQQAPNLRAGALEAQVREAVVLAERAHALAEKQHDEARRASDLVQRAPDLKALADAQRVLEADARRLALDVDQPLAENGRGLLNIEALGRAAEALEAGNAIEGRQRLEEAERELRRLVRDLIDVRRDPKALARRLAQRQEELRNRAVEALRAMPDPKTPEDRAALARRLEPLAERQAALAKLAAAIPAPEAQRDAAGDASRKTVRATDDLRTLRSHEIEGHLNESRDALNRLADALPDPNQRLEPSRRKFEEARNRSNEVANDLERHLRETGPQPDRPFDARGSATELANRLAPLAQKQAEAAAALAAMDVGPDREPQRARAENRARTFAEALRQAKDVAEASPAKPFDAEHLRSLRKVLPALQAEARATLERLDQKLNGQMPADDLAAELADEQRVLQARIASSKNDDRDLVAEDQRRIATALRALVLPEASIERGEAIRLTERAAKVLEDLKADPREAITKATQAVETLAARLASGGPSQINARADRAELPEDPALGLRPEHINDATHLARRERRLRERLQAFFGARIGPQEQLRAEAAAIGQALADLRERSQELSPRGRGPAEVAARLLANEAPRAMSEGVEHMAQGHPEPALDSLRRAADLTEQAARQADDLVAAFRADRPVEAQGPVATELGPAQRAVRQAARQLAQARGAALGAEAARDASSTMRHAARDLRAAATRDRASPARSGTTASTSPALGEPHSGPAGTTAAESVPLSDLVRRASQRVWGELPGQLRTEILQMSQARYRDDYARIIQLYFQELAQGGMEESGHRP
jgi:hypothetical protein